VSYTEAPFVVTLKGGGNAAAPWIVVRGDTADEVEQRLRDVYKLGPAAIATAEAFANEYAADNPQAPSPAVQAVASGLDGQVVSSTPTSPAPSTSAPQAPAAGGAATVEKDKWGGVYTLNHPTAPQTAWGAAVHFAGVAKSGKPYQRWIDPRSPKVPSNYQAGVRESPADEWPGDFAKPLYG